LEKLQEQSRPTADSKQKDETQNMSTYLHSDAKHLPDILLNVEHLDTVINLLFSGSKEPSERINALIIDCAGTQIMAFVLHCGHLGPLILSHLVFLNRTQPLFARKSTQYIHITLANSNGMGIS
jgi:hypothetical protein